MIQQAGGETRLFFLRGGLLEESTTTTTKEMPATIAAMLTRAVVRAKMEYFLEPKAARQLFRR
jgi:hypothetical protein